LVAWQHVICRLVGLKPAYLSNILGGGHFIHNNATRIAPFITKAMAVSKVDILRLGAPGQVPEKSAIPSVEMIEEAMASCLHASPGTRIPQSDKDAAMKPMVDRSQKTLATCADALGASEGTSHERTGSDGPVLMPAASARRARRALPWASP